MNKLLSYFIAAMMVVVLIAGVLPLQAEPVWYPQFIAFLSLSAVFLALYTWKFNKYLSLFQILIVLSGVFISKINPRAMIIIYQFTFGVLVSYFISNFSKSQRKTVVYGIIIMAVLQLVMLSLQAMNKDFIFSSIIRQGKDETVGLSGAPDQVGAFFALVNPVLMSIHPALIIVSIAGIVLSKSSFAFGALVVSTFIYCFFLYRQYISLILIVLIGALTIYVFQVDKVKFMDYRTRFSAWRHIEKCVSEGKVTIDVGNKKKTKKFSPLTGTGVGTFLLIFPYIDGQKSGFNYIDERFTHAHNDYLEVFFEMGYLGLIAVLIIVGNFIFSFLATDKSKELVTYFCAVSAYLLNALGNFVSHVAVSGMLLIVLYGMYKGVLNGKTPSCGAGADA